MYQVWSVVIAAEYPLDPAHLHIEEEALTDVKRYFERTVDFYRFYHKTAENNIFIFCLYDTKEKKVIEAVSI